MNRFVVFLLLVSSAAVLHAQKIGIPEIEYFNRRQYGGATQNWKVSQSENDLMYFANNGGLIEYDGVSWKLRQVSSNNVRSVNCIGDNIYIGTNDDFGFFKYDSLHHLTYTSLVTSENLKGLRDVWTIKEWNDKVIIHAEAGIVILEDNEVKKVIPSISRFVSCFVVNGMLLVHDEQQGLMEIRGNDIYPTPNGDFFAEMNVASIMALSPRELLIGTMNNGAFVWDLNTVKPWDGAVNSLLVDANIFCGTRYNDELLMFGTIQNGVIIVNNSGELVMVIDKDKGLMNNTVLSIFVDKEGGVWCGLDNGIARISLNNNISFLSGYFNLGTGYVQERYKDEWFFGTNQALFKIKEEELSNPLKDRNAFKRIKEADGQIWSLYNARDKLLCGHNLGVFEVADDKGQLITPSSVNGVWNFRQVPGKPDYLISGTYNGLILLQNINGRWTFKQHVEGFGESSRFMQWDQLGRLWVSHGSIGVFCLEFSADFSKVTKTTTYNIREFPGNNSLVISLLSNKLIIAGNNNWYQINERGDIEEFDEFDHFFVPGSFPSSFKEDKFQNLWLFYTDYIEVLRYLEDGTYKKITLPFIPLEKKMVISFESVYVADRENVFFGIEDGYAHYLMQDFHNFRMPFKVHLRSFKGRNDSLPYILHQNENNDQKQIKEPVYAFKQNFFEIEYAATFYGDKDIEYSTHLSGIDDGPSAWSHATSRQFTKIPEGDYVFTIKARNRFGVQSIPLSFKFTVLPPWHRHVYAKIAYLVLILIIAFIVTFIFNRRIEASRQNEKLKARQRYQKKEEQLTNEALRAEKEMIKMRNDKLRSEMKFKEDELAGLTVHIIQKNNLLSELQGQLKRIKRIKVYEETERKINSLIKKIDKDIDNESNWQLFESQFEQVHHAFLNRLVDKHADLTDKEKKLCAYIKMGMASKEIASLMNISTRSVENNRYKLRQKISLNPGDDLSEYISSL